MTTIQFKQVNYTLSHLMDQIEIGTIGLPDIQRPFVWKTVKVRDLFDSMYRGYPIGYLLFWDNVVEPGAKMIGLDQKQVVPQQLIVDGQQRLTSLYAVTKGRLVLTEDFKEFRIQISFSPLSERFDVLNAAIKKDPEWIPDISQVWNPKEGLFAFINDFIALLKSVRELTPDDERRVAANIQRLADISNFPFTALALSAALDEERVAEIFVRINSEGVRLNQADFILTLMSVFWDKGRKELEEFARLSRIPTTVGASPFNYFSHPDPDQLLRVSVAVAFRRARLENVYSILRGKDLQTGDLSPDRRDAQFQILQEAQEHVLDVTNWQEFLKALTTAGYRGSGMIASQTNLMYTYALYLIGRRDFGLDHKRLRNLIARWFYMTALTSRYTGSSETQMEQDLARLRNCKTADDFIAELEKACEAQLTNDYWEIKLPNDLERTIAKNPVLLAYNAGLCVLEAKVLFSTMQVSELLDPAIKGRKSAIERHHLFPRAFLAQQDVPLPEINQLANYALVEWSDNISLSKTPPSEYWPKYVGHNTGEDLDKMIFWHALPENWHQMEYREFLNARRALIARVIRAGWDALNSLSEGATATGKTKEASPTFGHAPEHWSVEELIQFRETARVEFKSSARWNYQKGDKGKEIEDAVVRTIAGFMNRFGGTLLIGVDDSGSVLGLKRDLSTIAKKDLDGYENWLIDLLEHAIGKPALAHLAVNFVEIEEEQVCRVDARRSPKAVFTNTSKGKDLFFIRVANSTREMTAKEANEYIEHHWKAGSPFHGAVLPEEASMVPAPETPEVLTEEDQVPIAEPVADRAQLEKRFDAEMRDVYERAKIEAGYNATYFLRMLSELGGLETARQLLSASGVSDGFTALWERQRLDLTVEARLLKPEYENLFTEEEKRMARTRLKDVGYAF